MEDMVSMVVKSANREDGENLEANPSGLPIRKLDNLRQETRAIYYRPDGTPTLPLPAHGVYLPHYLAKGFTLTPPVQVVEAKDGDSINSVKEQIAKLQAQLAELEEKPSSPQIKEGKGEPQGYKCGYKKCKFVAKSSPGLKVHMKKHNRR